MSWSSRQKFKVTASFLLIVLLVAAWFIYRLFFSGAPTCFDGKQNGNERGVDCGGGCSLVCTQDAQSFINLWEQYFEVTDGVYSAVAYFENPNLTAGIRDLWYNVEFYNQELETIDEPITKRIFVEPGKRSAAYISPRPLSQEPFGVRFNLLTQPVWEQPASLATVPRVIIDSRTLTRTDTQPRLEAQVRNNTLQPQTDITLVAILYDAFDNAIAASQTILPSLSAEATQKAVFTWQKPIDTEVAGIEIIVRQNPFEQ